MRNICTLLALAAFYLTSSSQSWQDVGGGLGNDVHGFCLWNNKLAIGGSFQNNPCDKIAAWDSLAYSCFGAGIGSVVRAVVDYNGELVAVGDFWNTNQPCTNCNGVAKWDGTQWVAMGTGFNNDVLCLTIWNGNVVAGGDFTTADGNTCYRVSMWNGTAWVAIGGRDTAFNNDVRALAVYNSQLWVGGDFSNADGCSPCDRVVKWNGTAWVGGGSGVDIPGGLDSTVRCFYVDQAANRLYMGGHFIEVAGNTNSRGVAVYNGNVWSPLGTGVDNYVRAIHKYNGNIIVGGAFDNAGGSPAAKVAKWNPTTQTWSTMGAGMNGYLRALQVYKGELYAGGEFTQADNQTRNYIAKWYETPSVPPVAAFTMSDNTLCLGQCINFTDNSSNSPTNWTWTFNGGTPNSSTTQNPSNICYNTPGTYTVTLTACNGSGCSTTTQTLNVSTLSAPVVALNANPASICIGGSSVITATGATTYSWSPNTGLSATTGSSVTANPTSTITYTVTGTSAGCTDTETITLTVNPNPTVSVTPAASTICSGSVNLTASGANTFTWAPGSSLSATTGASVTASPSVSTTYTITGTDANGCAATATASVTIAGTNPLPLVEGFENPPFLPTGWQMVDDANDGNIWQLNTTVGGWGSSAQSIWYPNNTINAPGTYDAFWTLNLDFMSMTSAQMTFDVAYCRRNNAAFSDTLSVWSSVDCGQTWVQQYLKGGTTLATAPNQNGPFTPTNSQWRNELINLNSLINNPKVMFRFRNHNGNGNNLYVDNINITGVLGQPPVTSFSMSQSAICENGCINFTDLTTGSPNSWNWTFTGGNPASSTSQNPNNICYATAGTYTVTLTSCNSFGCSTATQTITVNNCVGIEEYSGLSFVFAPNPFSSEGTLYINGVLHTNANLEIIDINGRVIKNINIESQSHQISISRDGLESGIYFYRLMAGGKPVCKGKFAVE